MLREAREDWMIEDIQKSKLLCGYDLIKMPSGTQVNFQFYCSDHKYFLQNYKANESGAAC